MRHAKSVKSKDYSDMMRPLKKKGINDAIAAAETLKLKKQVPDYIITSNAKRAVQTWEVMKMHLSPVGLHERNHFLYLKGKEFYYDAIKNIPDFYDNALIIGHNPDILNFLHDISEKSSQNLPYIAEDKFPTSSIISLKLPINSWIKLEK